MPYIYIYMYILIKNFNLWLAVTFNLAKETWNMNSNTTLTGPVNHSTKMFSPLYCKNRNYYTVWSRYIILLDTFSTFLVARYSNFVFAVTCLNPRNINAEIHVKNRVKDENYKLVSFSPRSFFPPN
jgi:hypothetical protein